MSCNINQRYIAFITCLKFFCCLKMLNAWLWNRIVIGNDTCTACTQFDFHSSLYTQKQLNGYRNLIPIWCMLLYYYCAYINIYNIIPIKYIVYCIHSIIERQSNLIYRCTKQKLVQLKHQPLSLYSFNSLEEFTTVN